MKWAVVGKGDLPHVAEAAKKIIGELETRGQEVLLQDRLGAALDTPGMPMASLDNEVDLWLTVGGDGSLLYCQHHTNKPVLGVNAGAVGFLTVTDPENSAEAIDAVIAGKHTVVERSRLACAIDDEQLPDAVNEVTLQSNRVAKLIRYRVTADGDEVDIFRGDGIIVSTATGSTGYAMSVGGPLLHPGVDGTVIAPIAPFKLASRPWVVPGTTRIDVTLLPRDSAQGLQQARCVIDGHISRAVETDATLHIGPTENKARYVRLGEGFYERVRTKLAR